MTGKQVAGHVYCTEIALVVSVASKISFCGHVGHVVPSVALFGSLFFANEPMLFIMASDKSRRPALLTVVFIVFAISEGPKLPKTNGRSNRCAAQ